LAKMLPITFALPPKSILPWTLEKSIITFKD
jgi:hypothetical protein